MVVEFGRESAHEAVGSKDWLVLESDVVTRGVVCKVRAAKLQIYITFTVFLFGFIRW
jgi:hypothetical protein